MRTLVLWDIDGTLIATNGVTARLFDSVFHDVVGVPVSQFQMWPGGTELGAFHEHAERVGVKPDGELFAAFATALAAAHDDPANELAVRARPQAGAQAALDALAQHEGVVQTVLTGNTREIARIKLEAFGFAGNLDLEVGAYGDEYDERPRLVPLARQRAGKLHGGVFGVEETVIVGDTPHDVAAARVGGARVVAVATGMCGADELRAAGADVVLDDLADTERVVATVLGRRPGVA